LQITGEHPMTVTTSVHPNHDSMGIRTFDISNHNVLIEKEDSVKPQVRLKEFADFDLSGQSAKFISQARSDKRPIIHWISENDCKKATLIHPSDGEILEIEGVLENHEYTPGTMLQIERIGYGILLDDCTIMFTHD